MTRLVELEYGYWVDGLAPEVAREIEVLSSLMVNKLKDAVLALALFEESLVAMSPSAHKARWERDRRLEADRRAELEAQEPISQEEGYGDRLVRQYFQASSDVAQAKWERGELPASYVHRLPFLYARSYLTSLAQVGRAINKLARIDTGDAQKKIVAASDRFNADLPTLKPIRDSIEHAEDRMRGRGRDGRPLDLQPIDNAIFRAPEGGVLAGETLNGRRFGGTVADGTYVEVEVSEETTELVQAVVQEIFDAIPWRPGHRQIEPSN